MASALVLRRAAAAFQPRSLGMKAIAASFDTPAATTKAAATASLPNCTTRFFSDSTRELKAMESELKRVESEVKRVESELKRVETDGKAEIVRVDASIVANTRTTNEALAKQNEGLMAQAKELLAYGRMEAARHVETKLSQNTSLIQMGKLSWRLCTAILAMAASAALGVAQVVLAGSKSEHEKATSELVEASNKELREEIAKLRGEMKSDVRKTVGDEMKLFKVPDGSEFTPVA